MSPANCGVFTLDRPRHYRSNWLLKSCSRSIVFRIATLYCSFLAVDPCYDWWSNNRSCSFCSSSLKKLHLRKPAAVDPVTVSNKVFQQTSSDRNLCQTHSVNANEMANKTVKKNYLEARIFKYERSNCLVWQIWYKHPTLISMGTIQWPVCKGVIYINRYHPPHLCMNKY